MRTLVPLALLSLTGCKLADELLDAGVAVSKNSDDFVSAAARQADEVGTVARSDGWKALSDELGDEVRDALLEATAEHLLREIEAPDMGGLWSSETRKQSSSYTGSLQRRWLGGGLYAYDGSWKLQMVEDNATVTVAMQLAGVEVFGADKMCSVASSFSANVLDVELAPGAAELRPELKEQLVSGMNAAFGAMDIADINTEPCDTLVERSSTTLTYRTVDGDLVYERHL